MNEANPEASGTARRTGIACFCACWCLIPAMSVHGQQPTPGDAVETFDPAFDVGIVMRPQAGLYGITELMMAALDADVALARRLIDAGADVNATDDSHSTALMWGVHSGDVEIVRFLISAGADVRARAFQGATAMINAVTAGHEAIAIALLEAGADPNGRGNSIRNFLEAAAESGMSALVAALVANGADLAGHGSSALSYAVARGHHDVAVLLLDAGVSARGAAGTANAPLLVTASASGNLDIVGLLLSRGAIASGAPGQRSPLFAAAAQGHAEVARLLMDSGASATPEELLVAIRNGHVDTAVLLIDRTGIDSLPPADARNLLDAADALGEAAVSQRLGRSAAVRSLVEKRARAAASARQAASREHARLLFARAAGEHCTIGLWDSRSGATTLLATTSACPEDLFVSADGRSVFVVDETVLRIVSTGNAADSAKVAMPTLDYRAWLEQMSLRPDRNPDYLPSDTRMVPAGVGRYDDGSLGLLARLWMPADDEFQYLFRRDGGQWSVVESRWCGRWGCEEAVDAIDFRSTNVWSWPEANMVWHENLALNPHLVGQSVEKVDLEYESYQAGVHERRFEIDGARSVLSFGTSPSEHSDTTHTFGIELSVDGGPPVTLSSNQCLTSLVGRFILVNEFFGGRFEVTNLATGKTEIGNLEAALWID